MNAHADNVHDLEAAREQRAAAEEETTEFEPVTADDLDGSDDLPVEVVTPDELADALDERGRLEAEADAALDEAAADAEATAGDIDEHGDVSGEGDGDEPSAPADDLGPCTRCNGQGFRRMGGDGSDDETCEGCSGTGREGAQGTLGIEGAGDAHPETGQTRAFDASAFEPGRQSRLGGRRATTGEVSIAKGKIDQLRLDEHHRIPKGATVRLEVVGQVNRVGERDTYKDGYHAGTVREMKVEASHVAVTSWLHDEDGERWDTEHGYRVRNKAGQWVAGDEAPVPGDDEPVEGEVEQPVEDAPATEDGDAAEDAQDAPSGDETDGDEGTVPEEGPEPQDAAGEATEDDPAEPVEEAPEAKPSAKVPPGVILGRPETYTTENLSSLKKDDLREVLANLGVSDLPAKIDRDTLLAMANTAAGNTE